MAYIDDVASAVQGVTSNVREQMALLFACGAESGCQPIQNRAGYPAYGPWQIALPFHPDVTASQADDPRFAAQYMYTHMDVSACVAKQSTWGTDPEGAALAAGRCIEHASPLEKYSQSQVDNGWAIAQQYSEGASTVANPSNTPPSVCGDGYKEGSGCNFGVGKCVGGVEVCPFGSTSPGVSFQGGTNPITSIGDAIGFLANKDNWIRIAIAIVGLLLIASGVHAMTGVTAAV